MASMANHGSRGGPLNRTWQDMDLMTDIIGKFYCWPVIHNNYAVISSRLGKRFVYLKLDCPL